MTELDFITIQLQTQLDKLQESVKELSSKVKKLMG